MNTDRHKLADVDAWAETCRLLTSGVGQSAVQDRESKLHHLHAAANRLVASHGPAGMDALLVSLKDLCELLLTLDAIHSRRTVQSVLDQLTLLAHEKNGEV